jgi:probable rRNA maturation factor
MTGDERPSGEPRAARCPLQLEIVSDGGTWPSRVAERAGAIAAAIVAELGQATETSVATVVIANDARVKALNLQFRGKDAPTNVLSFPAADDIAEPDTQTYLGDIILAEETVLREAADQSKTAEAHTIHLIVHGILHLLGYDHEADDAADEMEALEVRILGRLSIADPYMEELSGRL